jgi:periplasmic protein TonB
MNNQPAGPNRKDRQAIALITAGFIVVSALLHLLLGGALPRARWTAASTPSPRILVFDVLQTPTPAPPPSPRPSPTPQPTRASEQSHRKPASQRSHHPNVPQLRPLEPVTQTTSSALPMDAGSPGPAQSPEVAPQPMGPVDARYIIISARFLHQVRCEYPRDAVEHGDEGTAIVLLTVGPQGPSDFRIWTTSGSPSLDNAALECAKESTYSVPEVNGEPATETYRIIYTFSLDS